MASPPNSRLLLPNRQSLSDPTNIEAIERWAQNFTVNKIVAGTGITLSTETPAFGVGAEGTGIVTINGGGGGLNPWYQEFWGNVVHGNPISQADEHVMPINFRGDYVIEDNFSSPPLSYTNTNPVIVNSDLANLLIIAVPAGSTAPTNVSSGLGIIVSHIMGFPGETSTDTTQRNYYAASSFITGITLQGSLGGLDVYGVSWNTFTLLSSRGTDIQKPGTDIILNPAFVGTATLQITINISAELTV